jgi:hypothetical protein
VEARQAVILVNGNGRYSESKFEECSAAIMSHLGAANASLFGETPVVISPITTSVVGIPVRAAVLREVAHLADRSVIGVAVVPQLLSLSYQPHSHHIARPQFRLVLGYVN